MLLRDLPWDILREVAYKLRVTVASEPKGDTHIVVPGMSAGEVRDKLRSMHFDDNNLTAHYKGEDYGLARPEFKSDDWEYYQTHVRIYETNSDKGSVHCELSCHFELDPTIDGFSGPHLRGKNSSTERGVHITEGALSSVGVNHQVVY